MVVVGCWAAIVAEIVEVSGKRPVEFSPIEREKPNESGILHSLLNYPPEAWKWTVVVASKSGLLR